MKLTFVLMIATLLQVSANGFAQRVTLSKRQASLEQIFWQINKQTGYEFIYNAKLLKQCTPVNIDVINQPLAKVLDQCFENQPLSYELKDKIVVVKRLEQVQQVKLVTSGKVSDDKGQPLAGVSIKIKGINVGTRTDQNGNYTITVPDANAILIFTYIGFDTQEVSVNNRSSLNIQLIPIDKALSEVVVVAYGTQKKATLTGAVSHISGKELNTTRSADMVNMMTGKLPGLRVAQKTGEPGDYQTSFDIRGMGTPLVIVDGIPQPAFRTIDPNEVESISILKDASAAVYGVRAANGVVVITTKQGQANKNELSYSGTYGLTNFTNSPGVLNAYEYALLTNESLMNTGAALKFTPKQVQDFLDGTTPSTDWYNLAIRKYAPQTQHNINASGGSEKIKYFFSLGYFDEVGAWKSGDLNYDRINFRSNITANITKDLQAQFLINGIQGRNNEGSEGTMRIFKAAWMLQPDIPVYANNNPNYLNLIADGTHPLAGTEADVSGYRQEVNKKFTGIFALNYNMPFLEGLKARFQYSFDGYSVRVKTWQKKNNLYTYNEATDSYTATPRFDPSNLREDFSETGETTLQTSLNYDRKFAGNHTVKGLLLFEQRQYKDDNFFASRQFTLDAVDELFAGNILNQVGNASGSTNLANQRVVSRINYDYKGKYLLEASLAYEGSSKYAPGHQWGLFPAASAGWRISEESFIKNRIAFLDNLKLRASWGRLGDDSGSSFQWLQGYSYPNGITFYGDGTSAFGLGFRNIVNPLITWYTATTTDIGLDADLFKNKLHLELDWFKRKRTGLLDTRAGSLPGTLGAALSVENLNSDLSQGMEVLLRYANKIGKFNYSISANASYARNTEVFNDGSEKNNSFLNWTTGINNRYKNVVFGYEVIGQFASQEEINSAPVQDGLGNSTILPGDFRYADLNNDGYIAGEDQRPIARSQDMPEVMFGTILDFGWKGFDLNINIQGATSFYVRYAEQLEGPLHFGRNGLNIFTDRWRREDPFDINSKWIPGKYPSTRPPGTTGYINNHRQSDFWYHDASYLRIKSAELGYTLPKNLFGSSGIKSLRVFANGFNLLTLTKLKLEDPEHTNGNFGYLYPITQNYNFGFNITF